MPDFSEDKSILSDYRRSILRGRETLRKKPRPTFELAGYEWSQFEGVFSPESSPSTGALLEILTIPSGGSLLEIGCGTGIIGIHAALNGAARVVATDLSSDAVANTIDNARRHGVGDRVDVRRGDVFSAIRGDELFDMVFWHSNFVKAPSDITGLSLHDLAYVDPGYRSHSKFLKEALQHTTINGRALLGFSSRGDRRLLDDLAAEQGVQLRTVASANVVEDGSEIRYQLLRLDEARNR